MHQNYYRGMKHHLPKEASPIYGPNLLWKYHYSPTVQGTHYLVLSGANQLHRILHMIFVNFNFDCNCVRPPSLNSLDVNTNLTQIKDGWIQLDIYLCLEKIQMTWRQYSTDLFWTPRALTKPVPLCRCFSMALPFSVLTALCRILMVRDTMFPSGYSPSYNAYVRNKWDFKNLPKTSGNFCLLKKAILV